jgi:hypothetical protein
MAGTPFATSIVLSVFADPSNDKRAFASISESPVGATPWQEIRLEDLKPLLNWSYSKLLYELSKDSERNAEAREFGKNLHTAFFANDIKQAFVEARATSGGQGVRLVIDCSEELMDIPWELLHDGKDFLLLQDCSIIRVVRSTPPGEAYFGPISQMGLITVTPNFDASSHIQELRQTIEPLGVKTKLCQNPNREQLFKFLEDTSLDSLYFLGHGCEGQILLADGLLDAGDLAQTLSAPMQVRLIYLSSCDTAKSRPDEGVFSGVAQRLMLRGPVGAVIAMQAKISLEIALEFAKAFFPGFVKSGDPEGSLIKARLISKNIWARAIPALHTHVRGPEEFERNRLKSLFRADSNTLFSLSLPTLRMGIPKDDYENPVTVTVKPRGAYHYRGETHPLTAVQAAVSVMGLLVKIVPKGQIEFVAVGSEISPDRTHQFFFGSGTANQTRLQSLAAELQFEFGKKEWTLRDNAKGLSYKTPNLSSKSMTPKVFDKIPDYAAVQRIFDRGSGHVYFFIAGLGDRATRGAAHYLVKNWSAILDAHPDPEEKLVILLSLRPGSQYSEMIELDRTTGEPKA